MKYLGNDGYITGGDLSANIVGADLDVRESRMVSFVATFTGTATGSLVVEASNDNGATYAVISTDALAAPGSLAKNFETQGFGFMRMNFTFTAGTGALEVNTGIKVDDIH